MYSVCKAGNAGRSSRSGSEAHPSVLCSAAMVSDGRAFPSQTGFGALWQGRTTLFQQPVGGGVSGAGNGASFRSNAKWMIRQTTPTLIAESATLNAGQ